MAHTPKTFKAIHIYSKKIEDASIWIFTHLFFASAIILIFSDIFLHRISRLLKVKLKRIRVPTDDFSRQKCRTGR